MPAFPVKGPSEYSWAVNTTSAILRKEVRPTLKLNRPPQRSPQTTARGLLLQVAIAGGDKSKVTGYVTLGTHAGTIKGGTPPYWPLPVFSVSSPSSAARLPWKLLQPSS